MRNLLMAACVLLVTVCTNGFAQETNTGFRGWGPRVGLTVNPDQVHFGAHVDFGNFAKRLRFQPNVEVGIGDNLTIIAANLELNYRFAERWDVWTPYAGGGLGVFFIDVDNERIGGGSNTEIGLSVLGGIEKGISGGDRFFIEGKLGLIDAPDFKVTVGWTFGP